MNRHLIFLLSFIGVIAIVSGQSTSHKDTLAEKSHSAFEELIHIDKDSAHVYLKRLEQLASQTKHPRTKFLYTYDLAYYFFIQHKMDSSLYHYQKALNTAKNSGLKKEIIFAKIWVANHKYFKNEVEAAEVLYKEVIQGADSIGYVDGIANGYFGLASLENDTEKILRFHLKIDSIYESHDTQSPILSNSLGVVGRIYLKSDFIENAKEYFEKAFEIARQTNYVPGLSHANEILGEIELKQNNLTKSEDYFKKALAESIELKDTVFIARELTNLAAVDFKRNKYEGAIKRLKLAEKYSRLYDDSISLTHINLQLADSYLGLSKLDSVKFYLDYADKHPKYLSKDDYTLQFLTISVNYHEARGSFAKAFELQKKLEQLKVDIEKRRNSIAFVEFERRNTIEKSQQKINLLHSEKEISEQKRINQRNLLLGGLGITSLAGIFLFLLFKNRQKTITRLMELDQLKSRFFANISHEFRTPLTLISGPLDKRLESKKLSKSDQKDFELMQRNSQRMLNLVDQLLDLSKLEVGKYQLNVTKGDMGSQLRTLAESFQFTAQQKNVTYSIEIDNMTEVWFDGNVVDKIMANLLSNAFKYTKDNGKINVKAQRITKMLVLTISNTPTTTEPTSVEKLFERFYQEDVYTDGAGIGLSLVKELVRLNKGTIEVGQSFASTLQFTISLPISKESFRPAELADAKGDLKRSASPFTEDISQITKHTEDIIEEDHRDILLIVEDNTDVRQFVQENFEVDYNILVASNGDDGILKALEYIPDLIVSDIMMPKTDGLELCKRLKSDERTSHIPIVLLTARAGDEHEYEGLAYCADAYVTKPFKSRLLRTRVDKLIASRKALRNHYSQEVILKPKDIAITNLDEQFLNRVQDVLDSKLTESSFSIQEFSDAVGLSRMQLHRKLKALTGLSASEFVRSQRLKLAAALLEKSDINVSQIGYQVGFNDPSYFTKCFKEAYGLSPTEFSKKTS